MWKQQLHHVCSGHVWDQVGGQKNALQYCLYSNGIRRSSACKLSTPESHLLCPGASSSSSAFSILPATRHVRCDVAAGPHHFPLTSARPRRHLDVRPWEMAMCTSSIHRTKKTRTMGGHIEDGSVWIMLWTSDHKYYERELQIVLSMPCHAFVHRHGPACPSKMSWCIRCRAPMGREPAHPNGTRY